MGVQKRFGRSKAFEGSFSWFNQKSQWIMYTWIHHQLYKRKVIMFYWTLQLFL